MEYKVISFRETCKNIASLQRYSRGLVGCACPTCRNGSERYIAYEANGGTMISPRTFCFSTRVRMSNRHQNKNIKTNLYEK